jgi:hypothetical protein
MHIDHIDPKWEEGRDYQLVCGLDVTLNFCERDPNFNVSKNNRFLPWRVAQKEIGSVPVNEGDLCQFLDLATGEWVLEEFLGSWWFEQTKKLCGAYMGSQALSTAQRAEAGKRGAAAQFEQKIGIYGWSKEQIRQRNIRANALQSRDVKVLGGINANKQKWKCTVTGYVSTAAGLSHYQRHKGIDTINRTKV